MRKYTKEKLEVTVKNSICYSDVGRRMGLKNPAGGSFELIKNRIREFNIDVSHFLGKSTYAGKRNPKYEKRMKPDELLIKGHQYRISHRRLKRCLLEIGVEYKCSDCELTEWRNKPITLDIDHIDGDWTNCLPENLRFLCPNCHRQTDTFGIGKK